MRPQSSASARSSTTAAILTVLFSVSCGEGLPDVPLDLGTHDRCEISVPYVPVDASASEIQCLVEEYVYASYADEEESLEDGTNVPGAPACCEVCAREDTADEACTATCKHELCERAQDEHYAIGEQLDECEGPSCGFSFQSCLSNDALHVQHIDLLGEEDSNDPFYGLWTRCQASAADPVRPDGFFRYLEGLGTVPGAGGGLANVEDVVTYCQEKLPVDTDGGPATGTGASGTDTDGSPSDPPPRPPACGPYATQRFWVRPTNNFGTWNGESAGLAVDGEASYPVAVAGGGIAYTLLPCQGAIDAQCLRIDQLSARLVHPDSRLEASLGLVERSGLIPLSETGQISVPSKALRFAVRYDHDGRETLVMASNDEEVRGDVDARDGLLRLLGITASTDEDGGLATMSLHADLVNTQPATAIVQVPGGAWNRVSLTAQTFDAELDPITHQWMIPGVGTWRGDHIEVELPAGRHVVILRADDIHRSRGIAAEWIDIRPGGT